MLQNSRELYGNRIAASDGDVGAVEDFYFDDRHWVIRYVVAVAGSWLSGRLLLLSPLSIREIDPNRMALHVALNREQIQNSPVIESQSPVSREYEIDYCRYYGLPVYWPVGAIADVGNSVVVGPRSLPEIEHEMQASQRADKHLQSAKSMSGFGIRALDGELGRVNGLFVDDRDWSIPALVVETGHWYSGKEILISTANVDRISYEESTVSVNLPKADIRRTAESEVARGALFENARELFHD
jgi:hypothetical protein